MLWKSVKSEVNQSSPLPVFRPLLRWKYEDVVAYHKRFDVPMNPLYAMGARRVGCFPCINSAKKEIMRISEFAPERIDEIRQQEIELGSTFFGPNTTPEAFRSRTVQARRGLVKIATIDDVVAWSKTPRGGHGGSDFKMFPDGGLVCPSGSGMCE